MTRVATREGDKLVVEATNFNDRIRGTPYVLGLREDDFGLYGILGGRTGRRVDGGGGGAVVTEVRRYVRGCCLL